MVTKKQSEEMMKELEDFYCIVCEKFNCDCSSSDCFKLYKSTIIKQKQKLKLLMKQNDNQETK